MFFYYTMHLSALSLVVVFFGQAIISLLFPHKDIPIIPIIRENWLLICEKVLHFLFHLPHSNSSSGRDAATTHSPPEHSPSIIMILYIIIIPIFLAIEMGFWILNRFNLGSSEWSFLLIILLICGSYPRKETLSQLIQIFQRDFGISVLQLSGYIFSVGIVILNWISPPPFVVQNLMIDGLYEIFTISLIYVIIYTLFRIGAMLFSQGLDASLSPSLFRIWPVFYRMHLARIYKNRYLKLVKSNQPTSQQIYTEKLPEQEKI